MKTVKKISMKKRCKKCKALFTGPSKLGQHYKKHPSHEPPTLKGARESQKRLRQLAKAGHHISLPRTNGNRRDKAIKFCTDCGANKRPKWGYCGYCGTKLTE